MRNSEKTTAYDQMRSLAAGGKYRIDRDTEGFPVIPGTSPPVPDRPEKPPQPSIQSDFAGLESAIRRLPIPM
jgi:hypothetical protein